ncbi:creatininase family protein [Salinarimonas soli]|uniref:Creatininase family protein n=1 Tax=Salinarimonas soli TaxID=1638099 RepID=A0A5B2VAJ6_9HYPH|nr:creatininase family protein [Salinarimonas soli]KAA2235625.1 creatininase family protein [Salinarimonas soli]
MRFKSHWWWDHTSRDFAGFDMERVVTILPVGAVEQHGPHLPVKVDAAINAGIVQRAVELMDADLPVLVLPMMPIGKSNEHLAYPGTLTFSYETLARMWIELGESVHRAGGRRLIIFNAHGGQPQVIDIVCRELRVRHGIFAVNAMWSRMIPKGDLFGADELRHGIHAGEVETSVMLHLHGNLVDMEHAADFVPLSVQLDRDDTVLTPEGGVGFGWQAQDLHPSGVCGNAAAADAQRGGILVDRAAQALIRLARDVAAYPLDRIRQETMYAKA